METSFLLPLRGRKELMRQYLLPVPMHKLTAPPFLMEYLKGGNLTACVSLITMLGQTSIVTITLSSMNEEDKKVIEPRMESSQKLDQVIFTKPTDLIVPSYFI